jgi:hypothetical protein
MTGLRIDPHVLGRPIAVRVIFSYGIYVFTVAAWIVLQVAIALPDDPNAAAFRDAYGGNLGLTLSLCPAAILLIASTSLFFLRRLAVWPVAVVVAMTFWSVWYFPQIGNVFWTFVTLGVFGYCVRLRQTGVLKRMPCPEEAMTLPTRFLSSHAGRSAGDQADLLKPACNRVSV